MIKLEVSDAEIKADIMNRPLRKNCWGARYLPVDTLVNWIAKQIRRDGKRVRNCIEELVKEHYILIHKGGETISLNPARSREIIEFIKSVIKS
ncbi:MAG: hypothetical protein H5T50_05540 [Nitrososphaeria archaeon]|nr:hypothetical protein [Nitrososphaeria archaeon]